MASAFIERRERADGVRFRVRYRLGGKESSRRYGGTFKTLREARERRAWIMGELSALRVPVIALVEPERGPTVREACERWRAARIDVAESTHVVHGVALARWYPHLGDRPADELQPDEIATAIAALHARGPRGKPLARSSLQHSLTALRQALDHAGIEPNPARDRRVRLPVETREEIVPPSAAHVEAALGAVARRYRLPLLVLEATGMRVGELEHLRWSDVDERAGRWRVNKATAKTRRSRWVQVPPDLMARVVDLVPRDDRRPDDRVFGWVEQAALRTDLGRACRATGVPRFGLHDLRHRRLSLWHQADVPVREIAHRAGHARSSMTLDVYAHVLVDDREVDRAAALAPPGSRVQREVPVTR